MAYVIRISLYETCYVYNSNYFVITVVTSMTGERGWVVTKPPACGGSGRLELEKGRLKRGEPRWTGRRQPCHGPPLPRVVSRPAVTCRRLNWQACSFPRGRGQALFGLGGAVQGQPARSGPPPTPLHSSPHQQSSA